MSISVDPRTVRTVWAWSLAGSLVWLALIFLAPWLAARGAASAARVVYAAFSPTCHQIAARCFMLDGHPLAVCGRCLGIYAGFAAGLVFYPVVRGFSGITLPKARLFLLMTLPMAVDGAAGLVGLWRSPIGLRFATGFLWGTLLPFYFVAGVADLVRVRRERAAARALEKTAPRP